MISIRHIIEATSAVYDIPSGVLTSAARTRDVAHARQAAFVAARRMTNKSIPQIGHAFGDRDHTTVIHGIRAVERRSDERESINIARIEGMAAELAHIPIPKFRTSRKES